MSKRFELTPFAKNSLIDIVIWTDRTFGPAQADKYYDTLLEHCKGLALGQVPFQDCATLIDAQDQTGLFFARAGRHFIIFKEIDQVIVVLDFIHVASNLVKLLPTMDD